MVSYMVIAEKSATQFKNGPTAIIRNSRPSVLDIQPSYLKSTK